MVDLVKFLFAAWLGIVVLSPACAAETASLGNNDPKPIIDAFDQALLNVMKSAAKLGYDGRYAQLEPVIKRTFNVPLMTRFVVGPPWNDWTQPQRDQIADAFGRFITATYARRFDGYSGESFVIDGTREAPAGTIVATEIVRPSDQPVILNYLMRDNGAGATQVVDVYLTGTISELATRKSEFAAVLQRDGFSGLLALLDQKANNQGNP